MRQVHDQRQWIEEHGGSLTSYLERYGSRDDPDHYGDGGEAIYAADLGALHEYERSAGIRK
jgi:hypothetical protein